MPLAAALAFTTSFFVISIACDYRYICARDLEAMPTYLMVSFWTSYIEAEPI